MRTANTRQQELRSCEPLQDNRDQENEKDQTSRPAGVHYSKDWPATGFLRFDFSIIFYVVSTSSKQLLTEAWSTDYRQQVAANTPLQRETCKRRDLPKFSAVNPTTILQHSISTV